MKILLIPSASAQWDFLCPAISIGAKAKPVSANTGLKQINHSSNLGE